MVRRAARLVTPRDVAALSPYTRNLLEAQGFDGTLGQRAVVTDDGLTVYCGLGEQPDREHVRQAVAAVGLPSGTVLTQNPLGPVGPLLVRESDAVAEFVDAGYRPAWPHVPGPAMAWAEAEAAALRRARRWTSAPGQDLYPDRFAELARETARINGLGVDVMDDEALEQGGFGGILAVGRGSRHRPRLVDLRYAPADPVASLTLVGKGVTFDTGGLSLKSPTAMAPMRMDKVGAAVVLAVMSVLSDLGLPVTVRGLLPLAENMVGPDAVKPGDVATGRNGTQITIVDTDFEGRVLLSDALAYAAEEPADVIIDVAALTYQSAIALGNEIGALFANDEVLARSLIDAGAAVGEAWWRLPLAQRYLSQVLLGRGVKNHPESDVGRAITAGLFLERFVPDRVAWAHLDLTGPAWMGPASAPGATGFGVRTLLEFVRALASES